MNQALQNEVIVFEWLQLWHTLSSWSQSTFGPDDVRGPIGPVRHLMLEARECEAAILRQSSLVSIDRELADCMILVVDAARRHGLTLTGLLAAANEKMEVNMKRKWPTPTDSTMPVEHIRDVSDK